MEEKCEKKMMTGDDDLSPYERARLRNIERNLAHLQTLGIKVKRKAEDALPVKAAAKKISKGKKKKIPKRKRPQQQPLRRSKRLRGKNENNDEEEDLDTDKDKDKDTDKGEDEVDYETLPTAAEELDDYEFICYAELRQWRRKKFQELECEPKT